MAKPRLIVFYDGSCEGCVKDRARYEQWLGRQTARVHWFDITDQEALLRQRGIDPARALRELHVEDQHGTVRRELDAYILLFSLIWWLKPLAWLVSLPGIRSWVSRWYRQHVDARLRREGRG
ncbi:DCC1-like thiol-disulfide oxidoreductase family protein [Photobacterium sp. MCCC 1A19761]|uniref:thiol-disulfide oxidoreductase DCC family protein n=1 Tax=Photobacterium sp. MCCC 1A19761 TaxID=3115000 RepID=UPI00307D5E44